MFPSEQQLNFDKKRDPLSIKLARNLVVGPVGLNPLTGRHKLSLEFMLPEGGTDCWAVIKKLGGNTPAWVSRESSTRVV